MNQLPKGFRGAAIAAGLKSSGALDLTLIENMGPRFDAAAVYTSNKVVAAPVIWSRQVTKGKIVRAAILNSGGANACTGPQDFQIHTRRQKPWGSYWEFHQAKLLSAPLASLVNFFPCRSCSMAYLLFLKI